MSEEIKDTSKYLQVSANDNPNKVVDPITVDDKGAINVDKRKTITIDHAGAANMVLKHINVVPNLSIQSRLILTMKVMNPGIKNRYIAKEMQITEYDVQMYEREGINRCADYLRKQTLQDSIDKFNKDEIYRTDTVKNASVDKANPLITGVDTTSELL